MEEHSQSLRAHGNMAIGTIPGEEDLIVTMVSQRRASMNHAPSCLPPPIGSAPVATDEQNTVDKEDATPQRGSNELAELPHSGGTSGTGTHSAWPGLWTLSRSKPGVTVASTRESKSTEFNATRVVDLFGGCGGMSLGFGKAGFSVVAAFDAWDAAVRCYSSNFDHHVRKLDLSDVNAAVGTISEFQPDVIVGGPPCQDFSSAGDRKERSRADLTLAFAQIVCSVKPRAFVMENVERARLSETYKNARPVYLQAGYALTEVVLDASYYGVPQARKRFFCIGLQAGSPNGLAEKLTSMATADRLSVRGYLGMEFGLERYYRHPRNYNRRAIYSIDEPSATIRGVNRPVPPGYVGHRLDAGPVTPELRSLSTLERARVQTFPETFVFDDTKSALELMIGNAVPVELARSVASALGSAMDQ